VTLFFRSVPSSASMWLSIFTLIVTALEDFHVITEVLFLFFPVQSLHLGRVLYCCHFVATVLHIFAGSHTETLCFGFRLKLGCISLRYPVRFTSIFWIMESLVWVPFYILDAPAHAASLCSNGFVCVPLGHWSESCMRILFIRSFARWYVMQHQVPGWSQFLR
jgi:hypothetical protein